jgi:hypothetical protein
VIGSHATSPDPLASQAERRTDDGFGIHMIFILVIALVGEAIALVVLIPMYGLITGFLLAPLGGVAFAIGAAAYLVWGRRSRHVSRSLNSESRDKPTG